VAALKEYTPGNLKEVVSDFCDGGYCEGGCGRFLKSVLDGGLLVHPSLGFLN
jgi:hypothetical protein